MLLDGAGALDMPRGRAHILRRLSLILPSLSRLSALSSVVPVAFARDDDRSRDACLIEASLATVSPPRLV